MIVRQLIKWLIIIYIYILHLTCRITINLPAPSRKLIAGPNALLIAVWHGRMLLMPSIMKRLKKSTAVVSEHKDGEIVRQVIEYFGHRAIRGSSKKGAVSAMRHILNAIEKHENIVITPDGPRGPALEVKGAIQLLAAKYNIPIVGFCYHAQHGYQAKSWDNFFIPWPFTKITINFTEPLYNISQTELQNVMLQQLNKGNR